MMAFIINSLLDSSITEQFATSGKKQINTWRLVINNMCWLTNYLSVTRSCCKCIYVLPSFVVFITWGLF